MKLSISSTDCPDWYIAVLTEWAHFTPPTSIANFFLHQYNLEFTYDKVNGIAHVEGDEKVLFEVIMKS